MVLGDIDGRQLGALTQATWKSLQAVAAHIKSIQLLQLSDPLWQAFQVVDGQIQDLQRLQDADDIRDRGQLVPAQDQALEVGQMLDFHVDLCQTRTLADFKIIQQLQGIKRRGKPPAGRNPLINATAL